MYGVLRDGELHKRLYLSVEVTVSQQKNIRVIREPDGALGVLYDSGRGGATI